MGDGLFGKVDIFEGVVKKAIKQLFLFGHRPLHEAGLSTRAT